MPPNDETRKPLIPPEWLTMSEEKEIAEGDVSVSETIDGHQPLPHLAEDDEDETALTVPMSEDDLE